MKKIFIAGNWGLIIYPSVMAVSLWLDAEEAMLALSVVLLVESIKNLQKVYKEDK